MAGRRRARGFTLVELLVVFAIGAMLQLLRRVPVRSNDGLLVGRELSGATVGLASWTASCSPVAPPKGWSTFPQDVRRQLCP